MGMLGTMAMERSGDSLIRHLRLTPEPPLGGDRWQSCLDSLRMLPEHADQADTSQGSLSLTGNHSARFGLSLSARQ